MLAIEGDAAWEVGREGWPHVAGEKVSAHGVLRAGLRTLVVALDPLLCRPRAQPNRGRWALPRSARRTGNDRRQERRDGLAATDGALACRAAMVCSALLLP